jgi:glucan biosynthesis protein
MLFLKFSLAYVAAVAAVTAAAAFLIIISAVSAHAGAQKRVNPFSVHHVSRQAKAIAAAHGDKKIGIFTPQLKAIKYKGKGRGR